MLVTREEDHCSQFWCATLVGPQPPERKSRTTAVTAASGRCIGGHQFMGDIFYFEACDTYTGKERFMLKLNKWAERRAVEGGGQREKSRTRAT